MKHKSPQRELLPLTVWLCPDQQDEEDSRSTDKPCGRHRGTIGAELARHLVELCSPPDGVVVDAFTGDSAVAVAAARAGRRAVACVPLFPLAREVRRRLDGELTGPERARVELRDCLPHQLHDGLVGLAGRVDLVIGAPPLAATLTGGGGRRGASCAACRCDTRVLDADRLPWFLASAARVLKPGGHVAVTTTARYEQGRLFDPAPLVIRNAHRAGLRYTQHAIAVRVPVDGDVLVVQARPGQLAQLRDVKALPPVVSLHADVCLFTKPGREAERG